MRIPVLMKEEIKTAAIILLTLSESLSYPIKSIRFIDRVLINMLMPITNTTTRNTRPKANFFSF